MSGAHRREAAVRRPDGRSGRGVGGPDERGVSAVRVGIGALAVVLAVLATFAVATRDTAPGDDDAARDGRRPDSSATAPLSLPEPAPPPPVLEPAVAGAVTARQVRTAVSRLAGSPALGGRLGIEVVPLSGGAALYRGSVPVVTPASTMKLLTSAAALSALGGEHRFETSVVRVPGARRVVLVGGGDPLLTDRRPSADTYPDPATLADLARQAGRDLRADGIGKVRLSYDDSLFTGPRVNPTWEPGYITESVVSPITALWVDEGRAAPGLLARVPDPSLEAARRFAGLLERRGVDVVGDPASDRAPAGAATIATVESAPLDQIVQHVLETSDNEGAEVLFRQTALATGHPGSFDGGSAAAREVLGALGVDLRGAVLLDGSGLSRDDRLAVATLVQVLQTAASADHPDLRAVVSTLPVAGFTGSLDYRFVTVAPAGLGVVRAKTGTLTNAGVHGLAGVAMTRDGEALAFASVADRVPIPKAIAARAQLDRIAAALASVGSRP